MTRLMAIAFGMMVAWSASAAANPLAVFVGGWHGGGAIVHSEQERLTCKASLRTAGQSGIAMSFRCASASYSLAVSSSLVAHGTGVSGTFSEANYQLSGNVSGRVSGNIVQATLSGDGFTAGFRMHLNGDTLSVEITPTVGPISKVRGSLSRSSK